MDFKDQLCEKLVQNTNASYALWDEGMWSDESIKDGDNIVIKKWGRTNFDYIKMLLESN